MVRRCDHSTCSGRAWCCCRRSGGRVAEVARRVAVSRPAVWRWQRRFAEHGVSGLLRHKIRPQGAPPLPVETVARVVAMTCAEPPGAATHWTGRAKARRAGISLSSVQRAALRGDHRRSPLGASRGAEHDLQPHRLRRFKRSNDPAFAEKLREIAELGFEFRPVRNSAIGTRSKKRSASAPRPTAARARS